MQADQLRKFRKPDAFAVPGDRLEDRESASERLHAAALAILRFIVDVGFGRRHQPCDRRAARPGRLVVRFGFVGFWFVRFGFGARFHDDLQASSSRN